MPPPEPGSDPHATPLNPDGTLSQAQYTAEVRRILQAAVGPFLALPAAFPLDAALCYARDLRSADAVAQLLRRYVTP